RPKKEAYEETLTSDAARTGICWEKKVGVSFLFVWRGVEQYWLMFVLQLPFILGYINFIITYIIPF
ncbi:MAG: hypothetical protein LGB57_06590, partial [Sulfurovum sp.]|nr:hypothetical protein [Sulfurovum sp.]